VRIPAYCSRDIHAYNNPCLGEHGEQLVLNPEQNSSDLTVSNNPDNPNNPNNPDKPNNLDTNDNGGPPGQQQRDYNMNSDKRYEGSEYFREKRAAEDIISLNNPNNPSSDIGLWQNVKIVSHPIATDNPSNPDSADSPRVAGDREGDYSQDSFSGNPNNPYDPNSPSIFIYLMCFLL